MGYFEITALNQKSSSVTLQMLKIDAIYEKYGW